MKPRYGWWTHFCQLQDMFRQTPGQRLLSASLRAKALPPPAMLTGRISSAQGHSAPRGQHCRGRARTSMWVVAAWRAVLVSCLRHWQNIVHPQ